MSVSNDEKLRHEAQLMALSALTPGHLTRGALDAQLKALVTDIRIPTATPSYRFDNLALFETDELRVEIIHNVDAVLAKYEGDFITTRTYQAQHVETELLWATFQLYAHLQAIEQEVGLILDPHSDYEKSLAKLESCKRLLAKNGSDTAVIEQLLQHKPNMPDLETWAWYERKFKEFVNYIDEKNGTRLFWVWGRPTLDLALEYAQQPEAHDRLEHTKYIPGQISWSLYLFRGSLFFIKYMQKRFHDPKWLTTMASLSPEDQAAYRARYLQAYWDVFKYRILNDYIWGPINLACFGWWYGEGWFDWLGNFSTCFLLCMDIYLAFLLHTEEEQKYQYEQLSYQDRLDELTVLIQHMLTNDLKNKLSTQNIFLDRLDGTQQILSLRAHLAKKTLSGQFFTLEENGLVAQLNAWIDVYQSQQDHALRWQKKVQFLNYDRIYTVALLIAFTMCASLLVPSLLPVALSVFLTKSGTILCMALTIAYRTIRAQTQIAQTNELRQDLRAQETAYMREFLMLNAEEKTNQTAISAQRMQDVYLAIVKLGAQIDQQSDSIRYQYLELARTSLMRVLIPSVIGLTLVYAPATVLMVPTYVFALIASAVFAYALDQWAKRYKPPAELNVTSTLNVDAYDAFRAHPRVFSRSAQNSLFFAPRLPQSGFEAIEYRNFSISCGQ